MIDNNRSNLDKEITLNYFTLNQLDLKDNRHKIHTNHFRLYVVYPFDQAKKHKNLQIKIDTKYNGNVILMNK